MIREGLTKEVIVEQRQRRYVRDLAVQISKGRAFQIECSVNAVFLRQVLVLCV